MNASNKALEIASTYVGTHNIIQIEVRGEQNPHIRVTFERFLEPHIRKEIILKAEPFHVRFIDHPLHARLVNK